MILSHKHKFIFVRPMKVAGSSILHNLGKWCGDDDIVNSPDRAILRSNAFKKTKFIVQSRNFMGAGERMHITPTEFEHEYPEEWKKYSRIGCVRNPYDIVYSMYSHMTKQKYFMYESDQRINNGWNFYDWIKECFRDPDKQQNIFFPERAQEFWFDVDSGESIDYDFMIRYENLEDDYKTVCNHFNIPYEPLVKLNSETRLDVESDRTYQRHYNDETREIVGNIWSKVIKRYDYEL